MIASPARAYVWLGRPATDYTVTQDTEAHIFSLQLFVSPAGVERSRSAPPLLRHFANPFSSRRRWWSSNQTS
jgi:hypothetical protein